MCQSTGRRRLTDINIWKIRGWSLVAGLLLNYATKDYEAGNYIAHNYITGNCVDKNYLIEASSGKERISKQDIYGKVIQNMI